LYLLILLVNDGAEDAVSIQAHRSAMKTECTKKLPDINLALINDRMDRMLYDRRDKINTETSKDVLNEYPAVSLDCQVNPSSEMVLQN
jgi:hypothetical protein